MAPSIPISFRGPGPTLQYVGTSDGTFSYPAAIMQQPLSHKGFGARDQFSCATLTICYAGFRFGVESGSLDADAAPNLLQIIPRTLIFKALWGAN